MFLLRHNITINFSLKYVTFGITERTNGIETQVKNFIILLGKCFIFKNKYQDTQPTLEYFKLYLSQIIQQKNTFTLQMIELPNSTENGGT